LHQHGQLVEAEQIYRNILRTDPDHFDANRLLGLALVQQRKLVEGEQLFARALQLKPNDARVANDRALALHELKRFDEALTGFDLAISLKLDNPGAFYNRGNALKELKRLDEAVASYDSATALKPDFAEAFNNRGLTLHELKRFDEALVSYNKAISLAPNYAEAVNNRGNTLRELNRLEEALANYERAIALKPNYAEALYNRGVALQALNYLEKAIANYDKAIALKPDFAEALNNRGVALQALNLIEEAIANYDRAIALKPDFAEAYYNRGFACMLDGKWAEAVTQYKRVLALRPDSGEAKFRLCMAQLPVLYIDELEIASRREAYRECLEALCEDVDQGRTPCAWAEAIGSSQPFLLAYQGYNDRDLQSRYGSLVCRIMAERYGRAALNPPTPSDEPLRLGIVSGFFRQHTVWKLFIRGWLSQIDRQRFRIFGYHTQVITDAKTKLAAGLCDRFVQGPLSIERWREAILHDALDVLIYPEVGMEPVSAQLAAQRLAPVQCNSWGHPDTSGFPTLDYYLSSELMEPDNAQDHYSEQLVCLPNLSIHYEPLDPQPVSVSRVDLGLRSTATTYWCGQSLFKYLPQFDEVFPRIAREVDDCQFVFIRYPNGTYVTDLFRKRLDKAFAALGLRAADHCVVLPQLDEHRFVAAIGLCDIVLDSIGWSGGNSTLEGLHHDLPIVTMTGPLMRARHSMAILKLMGVEETVAKSIDDYVSIASRLARDTPRRMAIKDKIRKNKHRVYRDSTCILALQEFLNEAARRRGPVIVARSR